MAKIKVDGIELYYELHGSGEPLVLIGGLGADRFLWFRQVPELSEHFQVVAFDNRGSGESDKPQGPYSMPLFAADVAGLIKGLGFERAHVLGASLGGMIAQEFALSYPDLLDKLVLGSTTFGGPHSVPTPPETAAAVLNRTGDPETDIRNGFALFTGEAWRKAHPEIVDEYVAWRVAHPQPVTPYQWQAMSVLSFNAEDRLGEIQAPTLIVHGELDRVVPVENARLIASRIPNARLEIFPGGGHAFNIEMDSAFNRCVAEFLSE